MACEDDTSSAWSLAKGTYDLGMGSYAYQGGSALEICVRDMSIDNGCRSSNGGGIEFVNEEDGTRHSTQKVLNCYAYIVAISTQDASDICAHLRTLESIASQDFDVVLDAVENKEAARSAREFKAKVDSLALAHDPLIKDILDIATSKSRRIRSFVARNAGKAEMHANTVFAWARTFVPKIINRQAGLDKHAKLKMTPYIFAMAYAIRVKMDAHLVESRMIDEADRNAYQDRSRNTVDEFMGVLEAAIDASLRDASLLEIALDLRWALTTYLVMAAALRRSLQMMTEKCKDVLENTATTWDDGLSGIRAVIRRGPSGGTSRIIPLTTVKETIWWARFSDESYEDKRFDSLRQSIHLYELVHILGAAQVDASSLRLESDYKRFLTQLPPARTLRSTLKTKLAAALIRPPSYPALALESFARIQAPLELPNKPARVNARVRQTLEGHSKCIVGVALCEDNNYVLSASDDQSARVWSHDSGQAVCAFTAHTSYVKCVATSYDGRWAASGGSDNTVHIWSVDSGAQKVVLKGHSDTVWGVTFSPDGRTLASASDDHSIKLWNVDGGQCESTLTGHSGYAKCVAFSPDGQILVSGSEDKTIKVWNVREAQLERTLSGHTGTVRGVAITPDGQRIVSGSHDQMIKIWDLSSGTEEMEFRGHSDKIVCVVAFPDNLRIASGGCGKALKIWNLRTRELELTAPAHMDHVYCLAVSCDGRTLVSSGSGSSIKVWDVSYNPR